MKPSIFKIFAITSAAAAVNAVDVKWDDDSKSPVPFGPWLGILLYPDSIKKAASTVAHGLVKYYTGNNTGDVPGNLPDPYYCKPSVLC
jgi:mannan endo-1,6-alpha-mannosidase